MGMARSPRSGETPGNAAGSTEVTEVVWKPGVIEKREEEGRQLPYSL